MVIVWLNLLCISGTAYCIFMSRAVLAKFENAKAALFSFNKCSVIILRLQREGWWAHPFLLMLLWNSACIPFLHCRPCEVLISATCAEECWEASKDSSDSMSEWSPNEQAWICLVRVPRRWRKPSENWSELKKQKGKHYLHSSKWIYPLLFASCPFCYSLRSVIHYQWERSLGLSHLWPTPFTDNMGWGGIN